MHIEPAADTFAERYGRGEPQVLWTTLVADLETPVSAFLKVAGKPMSFLLESVEGGAVRGRYSVIGLEPDLVWRLVDGRAETNREAGRTRDTGHVRTVGRAAARGPARPGGGEPHRSARKAAAYGGRHLRLSRL